MCGYAGRGFDLNDLRVEMSLFSKVTLEGTTCHINYDEGEWELIEVRADENDAFFEVVTHLKSPTLKGLFS